MELLTSNPWDKPVYAQFREEIDPFRDYQYFRPLNKAYTGDNTFWSVPSPEPDLDDAFWASVRVSLDNIRVKTALACLVHALSLWESDGDKLVFAAILRAGAPIADRLCSMFPGSEAVFLSLFVGLGIDKAALKLIRQEYPGRKIVFVDGWTGRGGVAREIEKLGAGPLAVLNDPWGWADFSGTQEDIFCPTACFTGPATLGFSRTFYVDDESLFATYRFPEKYLRYDLVKTWRAISPMVRTLCKLPIRKRFFKKTDLRLHSNEVCRALINAAPDTIYFLHDASYVKEYYGLLLELAERRKVKTVYEAGMLEDYHTCVACTLDMGVRGKGEGREDEG